MHIPILHLSTNISEDNLYSDEEVFSWISADYVVESTVEEESEILKRVYNLRNTRLLDNGLFEIDLKEFYQRLLENEYEQIHGIIEDISKAEEEGRYEKMIRTFYTEIYNIVSIPSMFFVINGSGCYVPGDALIPLSHFLKKGTQKLYVVQAFDSHF